MTAWNIIRWHLRFYQLLGFHTLTLPLHVAIWCISLLVLFTSLAIFVLSSNDVYLYQGDLFGCFNDTLKFCVAEIAVVAIYFESLCRHKELARFWQLCGGGGAAGAGADLIVQCRQNLRYLVTVNGIAVTEIILQFLFWNYQNIDRHLFLFWLTFEPFVWLVHMRNMYFVLHLDQIRQHLVELEQELQQLASYSHFALTSATFDGFEGYLQQRLRHLQIRYDRIFEMCWCFREAFGYSVVAVLLMVYVRILVDCYFMYYNQYLGIVNIENYLLVPTVLEIPVFIYASQSCMHMANRVVYQLHNVIATTMKLSIQIQNFSLQILHQPIRIDGLGIAVLDGSLLTKIVCGVTTYMIFFIQFMPKFKGISTTTTTATTTIPPISSSSITSTTTII